MVNYALYRLALKGMGFNNGWQPDRSGEAWFITKVLGPKIGPRICLDIGANIGVYSELLLRHTSAAVWSFEPLPACQDRLERMASTHPGRMHVARSAVGDNVGTADLHYGHPTTSHASLSGAVNAIDYVGMGNTKTLQVDVVTLDSLAASQSLGEVDFIKIDVEGYELEVIRGAGEAIRQWRPAAIQMEWNLHQLIRKHTLYEIAGLLPGYRPYQLLPRGMRQVDASRPESNTYCYSNFVFMRE